MAATGFFHHIGTFLLFASAILILITTISAPVINDISILKVRLANETQNSHHHSMMHFGTFGHCVRYVQGSSNDNYWCTGKHIGYNPASIMSSAENTHFSHAATDTTKALTRVMVLHPVACGLAFIAFLLALGAGLIGSFLASLVAGISFIVTVVVMACDFVLFGIIKSHVNKDGRGHASYSAGMWCLVAGMIASFLGCMLIFVTCLSKRMHEKREKRRIIEKGYPGGTTVRRRWWQRRERY